MNRPYSLSATNWAGAFCAAFITTGISAATQSLQCGSTYTILSSDSLSNFAAQVFDAATLQIIFGAIAHVIGIIPVGTRQIRVARQFFCDTSQ